MHPLTHPASLPVGLKCWHDGICLASSHSDFLNSSSWESGQPEFASRNTGTSVVFPILFETCLIFTICSCIGIFTVRPHVSMYMDCKWISSMLHRRKSPSSSAKIYLLLTVPNASLISCFFYFRSPIRWPFFYIFIFFLAVGRYKYSTSESGAKNLSFHAMYSVYTFASLWTTEKNMRLTYQTIMQIRSLLYPIRA